MRKESINRPSEKASCAESAEIEPREWMADCMFCPDASHSMSTHQLVSISAMISYAANSSGQSEFHIERNLSNKFKVPNVKCLLADDFDKALRYLVDAFPEVL